MRKNIKHQFIWIPFFVLLLFNSCETKDGDWDDNIKLSSRQVQFESKGGSAIVTTKGTGWWFSDIYPSADSIQHTSSDTLNGGKPIDGEWYTIRRENVTSILIQVSENKESRPRQLVIHLQNGDYFDRIHVEQKGLGISGK